MQLSRYMDLYAISYTTTAGVLAVDCQNAEGAFFLCVPASTAARTNTLAISHGETTATLVACATTYTHSSTADDNFILATDVYKPVHRYVAATVASSASHANWIIGFKYGLRAPLTAGFTAGTTAGYMSASNAGVLRCISPTSTT